MRDSRPLYSCLVWAAAYAIAVQAVLLPLSVATAAPLAATVCVSGSHVGDAIPSDLSGCPYASGCGMQCHTQNLAVAPPIVAFPRAPAGAMAAEAQLVGHVQRLIRRPQVARAPPLL
jgi:hypothetical protein